MLNTVLELLCTIALTVMLCGTLGARFLVRAGIFGERSLPETWKRTVCVFSGHQSRNYYQKQAAYSCGFCRIGVYYNNVKERENTAT